MQRRQPRPSAGADPGAAGPAPAGAAAAGYAWPVRVYYEDTDAAGIVYYANFLKYFERCRTEWLRSLGCGQQELAASAGIQFVVTTVQVDYRQPARLDDALTIEARLVDLRRASLTFAQRALRGSAELATARVTVAAVAVRTLVPVRLPAGLLAAFAPADRAPDADTADRRAI